MCLKSQGLLFVALVISVCRPTAWAADGPDTPQVAGGGFTLSRMEATAESKTVRLEFTEDFDFQQLQGYLRFIPPVEVYLYESQQLGPRTALVRGNFSYGVEYLVSISEGFKARSGSAYARTVNTFRMPDLDPNLKFASRKTVIERDSRQMIHLDIVNVDEVLFEGVRIPPLLVPLARARLQSAPKTTSRDLEKFLSEAASRAEKSLAKSEAFRPFLSGVRYESHLFFNRAGKNIVSPFSVPLTFRESNDMGAVEAIGFRSNRADFAASTEKRLYRITDLSMASKTAQDRLLIWVTSLRTGEPAGDVALLAFDQEMRAYSLGRTDGSGLLSTPRTECPSVRLSDSSAGLRVENRALPVDQLVLLVAASSKDCSFLELTPETILAAEEVTRTETPRVLATAANAHLFTERGVYRPGETVHFKGTLREFRDGKIGIPADSTCEVVIEDSKGEGLYRENLPISEFGTVSSEVSLPAYAPLGTYSARLRAGAGDQIAFCPFEVQEFRPPRHRVDIRFRQETREDKRYVGYQKEQEVLVCTLAGRYYAGGPLKHGQVRWKVFSAPTQFTPAGYPGYSFGNGTVETGEFIESGESILDESGEVEVTLPLGREFLAGRHGLSVTASVVDFDGRVASVEENFAFEPKHLVGIERLEGTLRVGEPAVFRAVVVNASGAKVEGGTLEAVTLERDYMWARKRNEEGSAFWTWTSVWRRGQPMPVALHAGEARLETTFQESGSFHLLFTHRSEQGEESTSSVFVTVEGPFRWYEEEPENSQTFERIRLLVDKREYSVGETLHLSVKSRLPITAGLLTVEREGIQEERVIRALDGDLDIPITQDHRPNVYLSFVGTIPRGEFPSYQSEFDDQAPRFVFGTIKVPVRDEVDPLRIAIAPDRQTLQALPGQEATLDFSVRDGAGRGVEAELAVAVVDEQVLALTGYKTPKLEGVLDFTVPLSVFTRELRAELQNQTAYGELASEPLTGGGGAGDGDGVGLSIRADFNPTAYFNPGVRTDKEGHASVAFRFPDTMTTYRVFAVGCDRGTRVGAAERPALVVKEFYLEPGLPRFLLVGDEFRFNVAAFNKTTKEDVVSFQASLCDEVTLEVRSEAHPVKAHDRVLIPVEGKAVKSGPASTTLSGRMGDREDSVRVTLPVRYGFPIHRDSVFETLTGTGSLAYTFPFDMAAIPMAQLSEQELAFTLTLSSSPFMRLAPGLRYLLEYPYGCVEQTSSGILPLAALRSLIQDQLIPGFTVEETDKFLAKGVDRLFTMQTDGGGFSYWPGQRTPDYWGTLYALNALLHTEEAGFPIPKDRMEKAFAYLEENMAKPFSEHGWRDPSSNALAAFLLAKAERLDPMQLETLWRGFDNLGREGQLFALLAAHFTTPPEGVDLVAKTKTTLALKTEPSEVAYGAAMREPAVSLLASDLILDTEVTATQIASDLLAAMGSEGRWTSTGDTGWALLALGRHFGEMSFSDKEVTGKVLQPGGIEESFHLAAGQAATFQLERAAFLARPKVDLVLDTDTSISAQIDLSFPAAPGADPTSDKGFVVSKSLENTAGTETIHVGDVIKVKILLDVQDQRASFLALDDPLPAGLVAINSALATEEPVSVSGEDDAFRYWDSEGFYRFAPNFQEIREDRVTAFRDQAWKGQYQFTYFARAVCAGRFRIPPTRVQLMYQPDRYAYTPESEVVIEER